MAIQKTARRYWDVIALKLWPWMTSPVPSMVVIGIGIFVATVCAYRWLGHFSPTLSHDPADWASFATYMGGIAGPLLSFLALIAVVRTLRLQYLLLESEQQRQHSDQHIRWLEGIYTDISEVLRAPVARPSETPVTLFMILNREVTTIAMVNRILRHASKGRAESQNSRGAETKYSLSATCL
jgi:hypothetical protein